MPPEDSGKTDVSEQQPSAKDEPASHELSNDDLKGVSGGLGPTASSTLKSTDTSVCVSTL